MIDIIAKAESNLLTFARLMYPGFIAPPYMRKIAEQLEAVERGDIRRLILTVPPRHGKPIEENEPVLMSNGTYKQLKNIRVGDYIIGHSKQPCLVSAVHLQGNLPCKKITTFSGRTVTAAYDHPFLTPNGWRSVEQLTIRDNLALLPMANTVQNDQYQLSEFILAGYFLGDGCIETYNNVQQANFTNADIDIVNDFKDQATFMGWKVNPGKKYHYGVSGGVRPWFKERNLQGNSHTKTIPDWVFQGTSEQIGAFIGAYFACDGSITYKHKRKGTDGYMRETLCMDLSSVSLTLLQQTQKLLLRLGVRTHIRQHNNTYKNRPHVSYRLFATSHDDVAKFFRAIRVKGAKLKRLIEHELKVQTFAPNYIADEIKTIEEVGLKPCRCLTVEVDHTFTANDFVVHNSLLASQIFPAWFLGKNPRAKIMLSSHTQMLASDFGRNCRNFMLQPNFKLVFPDVFVSEDSSAKNAFSTNRGGEAFFMGVGGALLGRGADLALIDDPVKDAEQADSETYIAKLRNWYRETLYTRQMSGGRIIIIMQRWRANDLIGWLLDPSEQEKVEDWKVINFPAIAEEDDVLGREPGEALWPEKFPVNELEGIRSVLGSRSFNGLYQQKPSLTEGAIFKREWFHVEQVDYKLLRAPKIMYLDTAQKEGQANDFSAATWGSGYKHNKLAILGATKGKFDFPRLIKWTEELSYRNRISAIVVEDKSSGTSLVQSLKKTSKIPVIAMKFKGNPDKEERAHAVTPLLESGQVIFDKWSPESTQEDLFSSLLQFPTGSHDDDVDSLVGLLTYLSRANLKNVGRNNTVNLGSIYDR